MSTMADYGKVLNDIINQELGKLQKWIRREQTDW